MLGQLSMDFAQIVLESFSWSFNSILSILKQSYLTICLLNHGFHIYDFVLQIINLHL